MIVLALVSGIPPQAWLEMGARAIVTAEELLAAEQKPARTGPQMKG